jgi:hypothetical protein
MNSQKPTKDRQYNGKMKKNKQWFRSSNITKNRGYLRTMNTLLTTVIRQMPQVEQEQLTSEALEFSSGFQWGFRIISVVVKFRS